MNLFESIRAVLDDVPVQERRHSSQVLVVNYMTARASSDELALADAQAQTSDAAHRLPNLA